MQILFLLQANCVKKINVMERASQSFKIGKFLSAKIKERMKVRKNSAIILLLTMNALSFQFHYELDISIFSSFWVEFRI